MSDDLPIIKILNCDDYGKYLCIYRDNKDNIGETTDYDICEFLDIDIDEYHKIMIKFGATIVTFDKEVEAFFLNGKAIRRAKKYLEKNMIGYLVAKALTS